MTYMRVLELFFSRITVEHGIENSSLSSRFCSEDGVTLELASCPEISYCLRRIEIASVRSLYLVDSADQHLTIESPRDNLWPNSCLYSTQGFPQKVSSSPSLAL